MDLINILLVDDEDNLLEASKLYLEKLSPKFNVNTLNSAKEALKLLDESNFDVIISDYQMPEMDGLEFLSQLREKGDESPFIIFTGKGREEVAIQALNLGADFYLQKGGDTQSQFRELLNLIDNLMEKKATEESRKKLLEQQIIINRLALTLGETRDLNKIYKTIFQEIYAIMYADTFVVDFYDKETNTISPGYTLIEGKVIDITMFPAVELGSRESEIQTKVIKTGNLIYMPDLYKKVAKDKISPKLLNQKGFTKSAVFVPMKIGGEIIGILQVQAFRYNAYSQDDIELLSALANVAAVAIQNARLFSNQYYNTEDLIEEKNRTQLYLNVIDAVVLALDQNANVLMINNKGCELLGYSKNEVIGKNWFENFVPKRDKKRIENYFNGLIDGTNKPNETFEENVLIASGEEQIIQWKTVIERDNTTKEIASVIFSGLVLEDESRVVELLKESDIRYSKILENVNEGIIIYENDKIIFSNKIASEILGYTKNQLLKISFFELCAQEEKNKLTKFLEGNKSKEISFWITTSNQEKKFINCLISHIKDEDNSTKFLIIKDRTQEKLTQKTINFTESKLHSTIDSMGVPIHIVDNELRIIFANKAMVKWIEDLGLNKNIIGKTVFEAFPFLPSRVKEEYYQCFNEGKTVVEIDENPVQGLGVFTETRKIPVIDDENIDSVITIIYDITERVLIEQKLQDSEAKLRQLYDNLSDCIIVYDFDLNIIDINKKSSDIFGFTKDEFQNMNLKNIVIKNQKELLEEQNKLLIDGKITKYNIELMTKNKQKIPTEISANIIEIGEEKLIQAIIRDISEERKRDEERVNHVKELMFLSRTAFDFVGSEAFEDIYEYIGTKIMEIVGDSIVVVASYNNEKNEFKTESFQGLPQTRLGRIIKIDPLNRVLKTSRIVTEYLKKTRIGKLPLSLRELSNGLISDHQEELLKKLYNINDVYTISFIHKESLMGAVAVLLRNEAEIKQLELLETFASQSAVALLRKKAEEELLESEERYRKLFSDSYDGIILYNKNLEIIDINQKAVEILGYKQSIILKKKIIDFITKKSQEFFNKMNQLIIENGFAKFDAELENNLKRIINVEIVANQVEIGDNEVVQLIFRDITQKKIAEEIRARHIDTLQFVSSTAMDFVGLPPEENIHEFIGKKIQQLAGDSIVIVSSFEEAFGKFKAKSIFGIKKVYQKVSKILGLNPYETLISIDDRYLKMQTFGKVVKIPSDLSELTEGIITKKQNTALWKLLNLGDMYSIAFNRENKLIGTVLIVMKKNTEIQNRELIEAFCSQASVALLRKQAEEELRASEQRFKDLIDTMNDGFAVDDKNGIMIYVNHKFCEMLDYSEEEIMGKPAKDFILKKDYDIYDTQIEARRNGKQNSYEICFVTKNGEIIPTIVSPRAFIDTNENYQGSYAVITDITERKNFEEKLLQQQNELQKQKDELESFASTIAHDLRGKMQVISLYNSLSESEYNVKIADSIEEMSNFIEDLLLLAKKGEILGEKSEFNPSEILPDIITKINSLAPKLDINYEKLPKIFGDPIKIHQVFENILMNVVKHSKASKVKIYGEKTDNETIITVEDNGKGITEEKKEEIIDSWRTKKYTSFGMLIVLKVINAHEGNVIIESKENKGTKIIISLPTKG